MSVKTVYPYGTVTRGGKRYDLMNRFKTEAGARANVAKFHKKGIPARLIGKDEDGDYLVYIAENTRIVDFGKLKYMGKTPKAYNPSNEYYCKKCKTYHHKGGKLYKHHLGQK